jgi:hypothetical protein
MWTDQILLEDYRIAPPPAYNLEGRATKNRTTVAHASCL